MLGSRDMILNGLAVIGRVPGVGLGLLHAFQLSKQRS